MAITESLRDRWPDFQCLEAKVELNQPELEAGSDGRGQLVLRNTGTELIKLDTNSFVKGVVLYSVTLERAALFTRPSLGTGLQVRLEPDENVHIPVVFSTANHQDGASVALAPGDYLVKADLPLFHRRTDGEGNELSHLIMPLAPLRLVEKT